MWLLHCLASVNSSEAVVSYVIIGHHGERKSGWQHEQ